MIEAAIEVRNPSASRWFIEPCLRSLGAVSVLRALRTGLEGKDEVKQTGATDALYWVYFHPSKDDLSEELALLNEMMMRIFLETSFVPLHRSIISQLKPKLMKGSPLFEAVVVKARIHDDEYIKHRVEIQLGLSDGPLRMLPTR